MKKSVLFLLCVTSWFMVSAMDKDSTVNYIIPDSIKAVAFLAETNIHAVLSKKEIVAGIRSGEVKLGFESERKGKQIVLQFPVTATEMAKGQDVRSGKGELRWKYDWMVNESYKLMLATAADSATNIILCSGYVWLPKENKWKLIGSCKIQGEWGTLKEASVFTSSADITLHTGAVWIQRQSASWKQLNGNDPLITVNLFNHIDSVSQGKKENAYIRNAIAKGTTDAKDTVEGVYYKIMKESSGRSVTLNDTVTVFYKLTLFRNGVLVQETTDKPAVFPLKRLIKAWQSALPLCKVGGKIKLVIPSALAYSIRTRAAEIPPNSILQFEIEVVDAKAPQ